MIVWVDLERDVLIVSFLVMEFAPIYRSLPPSSASGSNRLTPARPQHDGAEEVTKLCQTVKNLNAMYKKDIGNLKNKVRIAY